MWENSKLFPLLGLNILLQIDYSKDRLLAPIRFLYGLLVCLLLSVVFNILFVYLWIEYFVTRLLSMWRLPQKIWRIIVRSSTMAGLGIWLTFQWEMLDTFGWVVLPPALWFCAILYPLGHLIVYVGKIIQSYTGGR